MKRRGTFLALAGLAMTACGTQSQPATPAPDPRAVRDQQAFARSAKELRDLHNSFRSDLDAVVSLIPTPEQQRTNSVKIDPQFSETAQRTISDAIQAHQTHMHTYYLVAYRNGFGHVSAITQPDLHEELTPVVRPLGWAHDSISLVCQNLMVAYRTASYRYISRSDLNQTRKAAEDARTYLAEVYTSINQPTAARGLDLASL